MLLLMLVLLLRLATFSRMRGSRRRSAAPVASAPSPQLPRGLLLALFSAHFGGKSTRARLILAVQKSTRCILDIRRVLSYITNAHRQMMCFTWVKSRSSDIRLGVFPTATYAPPSGANAGRGREDARDQVEEVRGALLARISGHERGTPASASATAESISGGLASVRVRQARTGTDSPKFRGGRVGEREILR